jgi:hypothetical protein
VALKPVTLDQARRWPAAAKRRASFCARMGGMRRKLTGDQAAADPTSPINRALAAWDCDQAEGLRREHVSKGIRMKGITPAMVGSAAKKKAGPKKNPAAGLGDVTWEEYDIPGAEGKTYHARYGGVRGTVAKQGGVWRLFVMTDTPARKPLGVWDSKNGLASGAKAWLPIVVEDRSWQGIKAPARKAAPKAKNPKRRHGVVRQVNEAIDAMARDMTVYQVQHSTDRMEWKVWGTFRTYDKAELMARKVSDSFPSQYVRVQSMKVRA